MAIGTDTDSQRNACRYRRGDEQGPVSQILSQSRHVRVRGEAFALLRSNSHKVLSADASTRKVRGASKACGHRISVLQGRQAAKSVLRSASKESCKATPCFQAQ
eukprot:10904-Amphidinium_carterae.1